MYLILVVDQNQVFQFQLKPVLTYGHIRNSFWLNGRNWNQGIVSRQPADLQTSDS